MSAKTRSSYFFVSYARKNGDLRERIIADLKVLGIECRHDQAAIEIGSEGWRKSVRKAINKSDGVILVATPDSRQSDAVEFEMSMAFGLKKRIYPLWAGGDDFVRDCTRESYARFQAVDIRGDAYSKGLRDLVEAIQKNLTMSKSVKSAEPAAAIHARSGPGSIQVINNLGDVRVTKHEE